MRGGGGVMVVKYSVGFGRGRWGRKMEKEEGNSIGVKRDNGVDV